jgi:hypothetical protein
MISLLPEIPQQLPPVVNLIQQQPQFIQPQSADVNLDITFQALTRYREL